MESTRQSQSTTKANRSRTQYSVKENDLLKDVPGYSTVDKLGVGAFLTKRIEPRPQILVQKIRKFCKVETEIGRTTKEAQLNASIRSCGACTIVFGANYNPTSTQRKEI